MNFSKNTILKHINGLLCIVCVVALLLPFCDISVSVSVMGASGDSSQTVDGITMVTKTGMWGYLFIVSMGGILLFSYVKQLSSYKKMASLVCAALAIFSLFLSPGNYSVEGASGDTSSVEVNISYGVGFWIAFVSCAIIALFALIAFLNLSGNPLFDAIQCAYEDSPIAKESGVGESRGKLNLSTEKIGSVAKNIKDTVSQQAGKMMEKARESTVNSQPTAAKPEESYSEPVRAPIPQQKTVNSASQRPEPTKEALEHDPDYILGQISKLFEMKEKGILTEEEFSAKKTEYLKKL